MSLPYIQSTMAQVRAVEAHISYPFSDIGDTNTKIYNMVCRQLESDYVASQVALDTPMTSASAAGVLALPFPTDSSAYFVGDTGHTPSDGGVIQFNRRFANIPESIIQPIGSQTHTFPGLSGFTGTSGNRISMTAISMTFGTPGVFVTTSTAHGLSVGDVAYCEFTYTVGSSTNVYSFYQYAKVLAVVNATQIRISTDRYYDSQVTLTLQTGYLTLAVSRGRAPYTTTVTVNELSTYILPGVTSGVSSYEDITAPSPFLPVLTSTGESVSTITDSTSPTRAEYNDMITDGVDLVLESTIERWNGNIFKQSIKQIKAK